MPDSPAEFVIVGVTKDGKPFRPSDWADRLCGVMAEFGGDERLEYSPHVRPTSVDGVTAVAVSGKLREIEPKAYRFLVGFAKDNELRVVHQRRKPARAAIGKSRARGHAARRGR